MMGAGRGGPSGRRGGDSGGKRVELPGWAVTSEPLAQLSPDVSPSCRPRLSWSSNDAPQLSGHRETWRTSGETAQPDPPR